MTDPTPKDATPTADATPAAKWAAELRDAAETAAGMPRLFRGLSPDPPRVTGSVDEAVSIGRDFASLMADAVRPADATSAIRQSGDYLTIYGTDQYADRLAALRQLAADAVTRAGADAAQRSGVLVPALFRHFTLTPARRSDGATEMYSVAHIDRREETWIHALMPQSDFLQFPPTGLGLVLGPARPALNGELLPPPATPVGVALRLTRQFRSLQLERDEREAEKTRQVEREQRRFLTPRPAPDVATLEARVRELEGRLAGQ